MKGFSLAGLLRLRRLQEDQAAASLARARSNVHETAARIAAAHATLASTDARVATPEELFAIAATRSSSASMLADLVELERTQTAEVELREADHVGAVRAARSIEKLETRHDRLQEAAEQSAEQRLLDELAARRARGEERS